MPPSAPKPAPYFNSKGLPAESGAYVAWIDAMGVRSWMLRSLSVTANFIFKLHVVALEEQQGTIKLYPVMDGIYVVSPKKGELQSFLSAVYSRLARLFVGTLNPEHQFLVRGAVGWGPVIHGSDIRASASPVIKAFPAYRDSILMGMPMIFALQGEPLAPPFGLFIHESAGQFLDERERKRSHRWWHWFPAKTDATAQALRGALPAYFDWCEARAGAIDYEVGRIHAHRTQADQYLVDA